MSGEYRNVWWIVVRNFINSFRPRQIRGNHMACSKKLFGNHKTANLMSSTTRPFLRQRYGKLVGKDYMGNAYYEVPADPSVGKRKPTRWYDPAKGQDFQDPIPAEWESWLRMRRSEPPTEEEIAKNVAIAEMKKINAAKIETKRLAEGGSLPTLSEKGHQSFPVYPEYHPGDPENKHGQK